MNKMEFFKKPESNLVMKNGFIVDNSMIIQECTEGSEKKYFIMVGSEKYLMKDSSFNQRRKQKSLAPYCEYVGSHFVRFCGIDCQETFLGVYNEKPVVICKNIFKDSIFRPFKELHQSSAGTDLSNKEYTYEDVLYVLQQKKNLKGSKLDNVLHEFWKRFLLDAILGNRDRHEGNWGFIKKDGETTLAPVFDNGSSLLPDVDLTKSNSKEFCKERVYRIPVSQFKMWKPGITDRAMRTNFWEMIRDFSAEHFQKELEWARAINVKQGIKNSIVDVPKTYANWFSKIIYLRFNCLILMRNYDEVWEEVKHISSVPLEVN